MPDYQSELQQKNSLTQFVRHSIFFFAFLVIIILGTISGYYGCSGEQTLLTYLIGHFPANFVLYCIPGLILTIIFQAVLSEYIFKNIHTINTFAMFYILITLAAYGISLIPTGYID
ncbi:MAG: hypothetical protein LWY06_10635 [Firmicutes bacterium]|nr:hypothetical protein [Bacillota bacterium]